MIGKEWNGDIYEIPRRPHRCVEITINNGKWGEKLQIVNAYVHRAKYNEFIRWEYWGDVKYLLEQRNGGMAPLSVHPITMRK